MVPVPSFLPGKIKANELVRQRALRNPSLVFVALFLIPPIYSSLLSYRALFHQRFSTEFSQYLQKHLYILVMLAVSSLIFAVSDSIFFGTFNCLNWEKLGILRSACVVKQLRTLVISF